MSNPKVYADKVNNALLKMLPEVRNARGWSIYELGKMAGVTGQVIHNIEVGRTKPSLEMFARLAWALDLDMTELSRRLEPVSLAQSQDTTAFGSVSIPEVPISSSLSSVAQL